MTLRTNWAINAASFFFGIALVFGSLGCQDSSDSPSKPVMTQGNLGEGDRGPQDPPPQSCQATCDGLSCGQNACGEPCGTCRPGSVCEENQCTCAEKLPTAFAGGKPGASFDQCGDVGPAGRCDGHILKKCVDGELTTTPCSQFGLACGWDQGLMAYEGGFACVETQTLCPDIPDSGRCDDQVLRWCDEATGEIQTVDCAAEGTFCGWTGSFFCCHEQDACAPLCQGKSCGDDSCGGDCGDCGTGEACSPNGQCFPEEPPEVECSADSKGSCNGSILTYEANDCCVETDCRLAFASEPGLNQVGVCGLDTETGNNTCVACNPSCINKQCGDDGCGDDCGACKYGGACRPDGTCEDVEKPFCVGKSGGTPCNDGDACTEADACWDDTCVAGSAKHCSDGNKCTADSCDSETGCAFVNTQGTSCSDGDDCTVGDACWDGGCRPGADTLCDDGNVCTHDYCNDGKCSHGAFGDISCDDGDACSINDRCEGDTCKGAEVLACDDGNPCTTDVCDEEKGCVSVNADRKACSDGNACTVSDACWDGSCKAGGAAVCSDGNPCTNDACDPALGCVFANADGKTCSDGSACTVADACWDGSCRAGKPLTCNDGNSCTRDTCDASRGCVATNTDGASCDDASACTSGDKCWDGACKGKAASCDDKNVCTTDFCDPQTGCVNQTKDGATCDDGNQC
ncbi:MAG: hypothetical protein ACI9WU_001524, partial [Myxococcota bacterium]